MKYNEITLHQRISLKGIFTSAKERRDIGILNPVPYEHLNVVMKLWNFKIAIEYFLTDDINLLSKHSQKNK